MAKVLLIDDDPDQLDLIKTFLENCDCQLSVMIDGNKVIDEIERFKPDVVITDIMMPGMTGSSVYDAIREEVGPNMPIILSSGTNLHIKGKKDPLLAYCPKPVDFDNLKKTVQDMISIAREKESETK